MSSWLELTIQADPQSLDALGAAVVAQGSVGTWARAPGLLIAYFQPDVLLNRSREILQCIRTIAGDRVCLNIRALEHEDWNATWKASWQPLQIGPRLVIAPTWIACDLKPDQILIRLDPGMAFGTGHHATTRVCLRLLDEYARRREVNFSMLDFGTGSGILAIAGARLGADRVVAVDCDPEALSAARTNAAQNEVSDRIAIEDTEAAWRSGPYELIVANVTAEVLVDYAPFLSAQLTNDGEAILSGILQDRESLVTAALEENALVISERVQDEEWVTFRAGRGSESVGQVNPKEMGRSQ